jgi:peptide/nickel transport system ATP-binding protein
LYTPSKGQFSYEGHKIVDQKAHWDEVQFIFQDPFSCFNQFFTIRSQLEAAFKIKKVKLTQQEISDRVDAGLMAVNVAPKDIEGKYPFELSGGQMQRAAIARALLNRPKILLADEPTGNLDSANGEAIIGLFEKIREEYGTTIVVVTHDPKIAARADREISLKDGLVV